MAKKRTPKLRRGWTTGACAAAATKAAYTALLTGEFPDPVEIALPKGERPTPRREAALRARRARGRKSSDKAANSGASGPALDPAFFGTPSGDVSIQAVASRIASGRLL